MILSTASGERLVSDFAAAEVASAISKRVRMGQLTAEAGHSLLAGFDEWTASDAIMHYTAARDIAEATRLTTRDAAAIPAKPRSA